MGTTEIYSRCLRMAASWSRAHSSASLQVSLTAVFSSLSRKRLSGIIRVPLALHEMEEVALLVHQVCRHVFEKRGVQSAAVQSAAIAVWVKVRADVHAPTHEAPSSAGRTVGEIGAVFAGRTHVLRDDVRHCLLHRLLDASVGNRHLYGPGIDGNGGERSLSMTRRKNTHRI